MIPPEEAWARLEPHLAPLPEERLALRDALGRVLARPLAARVDVPPFDASAMDGYALAGAPEPGERRPVVGTVAAGDAPGLALLAGTAARVMTGAPLPAGTDRVLPVEETDGGRDVVELRAVPAAGEHVRRRGEVVRAGEELFAAGALLTPGALALLAAHGYDELPARRAPRVAVLATGNELVPAEAEPGPGQLRDSNTPFLLAAGATLGLAFEPLGIARDEPEALGAALGRGLGADLLLVCGGVSAGEFDLVEPALARLGCETLFDAVAVQPGKPLVAAVHPGGLIVGLPGNPAAVMVDFWLFVRPALRRLLGGRDGYWQGALRGRLTAPLAAARGRTRYLPAEVAFAEGELLVAPVAPKGSHDLAAYARGTALVRVPAGAPPAPAGAACEVLPLADWRS
ncbi:MAG TPA: gephyrin-like molybdotransferase Glp [Thermoanaerobaculia bacterium]|nr:gephyrin-like molybdotransferase Glp [Thermoanaerobaculia bacterium]